MATDYGSGRRSMTDMRKDAVLALEYGPMARNRLAGIINVNYAKLADEIVPQLQGLGLVVLSPEGDVQLTSAGIEELKTLKGSKILTKSEAES